MSKIVIFDEDNNKKYVYESKDNEVSKNIKPFEYLYMMDDSFTEIVSLDIAVKFHFGNNARFERNHSIISYIFGKIVSDDNVIIKNAVITIS